jgi:hypothetical protein
MANNRTRNAVGNRTADQNYRHRTGREQRGVQRPRRNTGRQGFHPQPKLTGNFGQVQAEEILDLRTGDQDRDAVGKSDHDRPRNKLAGRAHAGRPQGHQYHSRHHGAHEQAIDAVHGDNTRYHHYKRARRTSDLRFRSTQR